MSSLSSTDHANLQADLGGLKNALLMGVLVGAGSIVLKFSDGASVLVQCPFEVEEAGQSHSGHGESPATSATLFGLLNHRVSGAKVDKRGRTTFDFEAGGKIRLIPDDSGFEAYVVNTTSGVFPVIVR